MTACQTGVMIKKVRKQGQADQDLVGGHLLRADGMAQKGKNDGQAGKGGHHDQDRRGQRKDRQEEKNLKQDRNFPRIFRLPQADIQGGKRQAGALSPAEGGRQSDRPAAMITAMIRKMPLFPIP